MNTKTSKILFASRLLAFHAARAARHWNIWGAYASRRYAERHNVPSGILTLARVLANAERVGL